MRAALQRTVDLLAEHQLQCTSYVVDIASREAVYAAAQRVRDEVGAVDILVNNAGIVACKTFWDLPDKVIESTYAVNILAHYWVSCMMCIFCVFFT